MPTFDGETLIITLDSGVTTVDIQEDLYEPWKAWMLAGNMRYPTVFRTIGGDPLSAIINAGAYFFLQNQSGWRIKPPEEDITIYLTGNLAAEDTESPAIVATTGAYTAAILGLQPVTQGVTQAMGAQLEQISFGGRVHLDTTNGVPLTITGKTAEGELIGTHGTPVGNLTDAKTLLISRGFAEIHVMNILTIGATDDVDGLTLAGDGLARTIVTFVSGASTSNTQVKDMTIGGDLDGALTADRTLFETVTGIGCTTNAMVLNECLFSGSMTLRADNTQDLNLVNCGSISNNVFLLDINGTVGDITLLGYTDRVQINNITSFLNFHIAGAGCELTLDASCTAGFAEIHGDAVLINNSTIPTVDDDTNNSLLNHIERAVWIDTEQVAGGNGTQASPFNTLTAGIDFAENLSIKILYIYADIVLDRQLKNFKVIGVGTPTIDTNGQDLTKSEFWHCRMEGTYTGIIVVQESVLLNNFYLNGVFEKCGLAGDLFCIDNSAVLLTQCISMIPGLGRPTISMNATGTTQLSVRKNGGGMTIKDCNQPTDAVTVEMSEGSLTFDASCTDGEMVARGDCKFVDLATAAGAFVTDDTTPNLVWTVPEGFSVDSKIVEMWQLRGLDINNPVSIDDTGVKTTVISDDILIDITDTSIVRGVVAAGAFRADTTNYTTDTTNYTADMA